jgi:hypothetical protein
VIPDFKAEGSERVSQLIRPPLHFAVGERRTGVTNDHCGAIGGGRRESLWVFKAHVFLLASD